MRLTLTCLVVGCLGLTSIPVVTAQLDPQRVGAYSAQGAASAIQDYLNSKAKLDNIQHFYLHTILASSMPDHTWYKSLAFLNPNPEFEPAIADDVGVCTIFWRNYQFGIRSARYEIIEDPGPYNPDLSKYMIAFPRVRTCDADRMCTNCYRTMLCTGCYMGGTHTAWQRIRFAITDDRPVRQRAAYIVATCSGMVQIDCSQTSLCKNGQFASDVFRRDPITNIVVTSPECKPCSPGTWNTCIKYGECMW